MLVVSKTHFKLAIIKALQPTKSRFEHEVGLILKLTHAMHNQFIIQAPDEVAQSCRTRRTHTGLHKGPSPKKTNPFR
mgnify:CR=1 FL=1